MSYNKFADKIIDELKLGISYIPNIIFILICIFGVITELYIMIQFNFIFELLMLLIYGITYYFLYQIAKKDHPMERRHKTLNKYK